MRPVCVCWMSGRWSSKWSLSIKLFFRRLGHTHSESIDLVSETIFGIELKLTCACILRSSSQQAFEPVFVSVSETGRSMWSLALYTHARLWYAKQAWTSGGRLSSPVLMVSGSAGVHWMIWYQTNSDSRGFVVLVIALSGYVSLFHAICKPVPLLNTLSAYYVVLFNA